MGECDNQNDMTTTNSDSERQPPTSKLRKLVPVTAWLLNSRREHSLAPSIAVGFTHVSTDDATSSKIAKRHAVHGRQRSLHDYG